MRLIHERWETRHVIRHICYCSLSSLNHGWWWQVRRVVGRDQPRPLHRHRWALGGLGGGHDGVRLPSQRLRWTTKARRPISRCPSSSTQQRRCCSTCRRRCRSPWTTSAPAAAIGSPASARTPTSSASGSARQEPHLDGPTMAWPPSRWLQVPQGSAGLDIVQGWWSLLPKYYKCPKVYALIIWTT